MPETHLVRCARAGCDGFDACDVCGEGYQYLLKLVAAGDGDRSLSTPLTHHDPEVGAPPGFWMGSGAVRPDHGELGEGAQVSEAQLQLPMGMGHDPITGEPLGRATSSSRRWPSGSSSASTLSIQNTAQRHGRGRSQR